MSSVPPSFARWKVVCAYDGTSFTGWQSQPGGGSIQDAIEARLTQLAGKLERVHASGRTDAGVHALAQVFHFDLPWKHGAARLKAALRVNLPPGLQIKAVRAVSSSFHARFSATGKRYRYRIYLGDADPFIRPFVWAIERPTAPNVEAMQVAARSLCGRHDFAAFSAFNGSENDDTVRTLRRLDVRRTGRHVTVTAEADGFLYKMVRSLVGALVSVGWGKLTPAQIIEFLESGRRTPAVETAPPQGLCLIRVFYD
ncbi:MAG: tRNA pseudouridine(38-40) synthase TruA [Opitutaceae bacterium]|nr:tRNA pseudouridine(38-40) synthase TruA [Opitutaceae bacterium]